MRRRTAAAAKRAPVRRPRKLARPELDAGPQQEVRDLLYGLHEKAGMPALEDLAKQIAGDDRLDGSPKKDLIHRIISRGGPASLVDVRAVTQTLARACGLDEYTVAAQVNHLVRPPEQPSVPGPLPSPRSTDLATLVELEQRAIARMRERLQSLQLSADVIRELETRRQELAPLVDFRLAPSPTVIVGDLGSGKSTCADMLHQGAIGRARSDATAPWPVFLQARDLTADKLEAAVRAASPPAAASWHVIVDGLDEVDRDTARGLLAQARHMDYLSTGSEILLFSRPGYISIDAVVTIPPLTDEQIELILTIAGGEHTRRWSLPRALSAEAVKPLFALLAARFLHHGTRRFRTPIELLGDLAEEVLDRESMAGVDVHAALRRLATRTIAGRGRVRGREAGPLEIRQALVATRLVVQDSEVLRFASPILEQYFAARALLEKEVPLAQQLVSLRAWELWRSAWLLAAAIGTWEESSEPLAALVEAHPGAAAWVLGEAVPLTDPPLHGEAAVEPDSQARVRLAVDAWSAALPHLFASWAAGPMADPSARLAIDCGNGWVDLAVEEQGLGSRRQGVALSTHPAAPWRAALHLAERSAVEVLTAMRTRPDIDVLRGEWWHDRATGLIPTSFSATQYRLHETMTFTERVAYYGTELLSRLDEFGAESFGLRDQQYTRGEVLELVNIAQAGDPDGLLADPWPGRDAGPIPPDAVWSGYRADQLTARVRAVHLAAMKAYEEIVGRYFPTLAATMERALLVPYRVEYHIFVGATAGATTVLIPLVAGEEVRVDIAVESHENINSAYARGRLSKVHELVIARRPDGASWVWTSVHGGRINVADRMPATNLAVRWVWDDLNRLRLIRKKTPPSW